MNKAKTGVLLVNLGTPESPTPKAISRYLWQFLTDPRVVDLPRYKWFPLLKGLFCRYALNVSPKLRFNLDRARFSAFNHYPRTTTRLTNLF